MSTIPDHYDDPSLEEDDATAEQQEVSHKEEDSMPNDDETATTSTCNNYNPHEVQTTKSSNTNTTTSPTTKKRKSSTTSRSKKKKKGRNSSSSSSGSSSSRDKKSTVDSPSDTNNHQNRTKKSCHHCRASHLKCDGKRPCVRCIAKKRDCIEYDPLLLNSGTNMNDNDESSHTACAQSVTTVGVVPTSVETQRPSIGEVPVAEKVVKKSSSSEIKAKLKKLTIGKKRSTVHDCTDGNCSGDDREEVKEEQKPKEKRRKKKEGSKKKGNSQEMSSSSTSASQPDHIKKRTSNRRKKHSLLMNENEQQTSSQQSSGSSSTMDHHGDAQPTYRTVKRRKLNELSEQQPFMEENHLEHHHSHHDTMEDRYRTGNSVYTSVHDHNAHYDVDNNSHHHASIHIQYPAYAHDMVMPVMFERSIPTSTSTVISVLDPMTSESHRSHDKNCKSSCGVITNTKRMNNHESDCDNGDENHHHHHVNNMFQDISMNYPSHTHHDNDESTSTIGSSSCCSSPESILEEVCFHGSNHSDPAVYSIANLFEQDSIPDPIVYHSGHDFMSDETKSTELTSSSIDFDHEEMAKRLTQNFANSFATTSTM